MSKSKTFIYKNIGAEQDIKGVGLVREGETIAVPHKQLKYKDLELQETVEAVVDEPAQESE